MDSMITSQQEIQVYLLFCKGFKIGHVVLSYGKMGISVLFCSVLAACALAVTQFQISTSSTIIAAWSPILSFLLGNDKFPPICIIFSCAWIAAWWFLIAGLANSLSLGTWLIRHFHVRVSMLKVSNESNDRMIWGTGWTPPCKEWRILGPIRIPNGSEQCMISLGLGFEPPLSNVKHFHTAKNQKVSRANMINHGQPSDYFEVGKPPMELYCSYNMFVSCNSTFHELSLYIYISYI